MAETTISTACTAIPVTTLPAQGFVWVYQNRSGMFRARPSVNLSKTPFDLHKHCGPGWDRTSDLPRVKLTRSQKRDVCAGQTGRIGPILRVRSTQSKRRGGCGADENESLIPTLPEPGRRSNQAESAANGRVGGVAGTVVTVVKAVVS